MGDILDAAGSTVILAFDLADSQLASMSMELQRALQKPEVESAIQDVLARFALARQRSGTAGVSDQEAKQLASDLWKKAGGKVTDDVLNQLKKTPEFQKLEKSLTNLEQALKSSPLGVWVDKNKNILYIVGAGLAIGGAIALYVTRTGGPAINLPLSQLSGKPIKIYKVGGFSLSGKILSFKPDLREVGGSLVLSQNISKKLDISVEFGIIATGSDAKKIDGKIVAKTKDIQLGVAGSQDLSKKTLSLGFSVGLNDIGGQGPLTIDITGVVKDGRLNSGQLQGDWQLDKTTILSLQGTTSSGETKGMVLLSKRF